MDSAVSHLYHFCSSLSAGSYIDVKPFFSFHPDVGDTVTAEVTLPVFMPPELQASGVPEHGLQRQNARKDAAFEAYISLYKAWLGQ